MGRKIGSWPRWCRGFGWRMAGRKLEFVTRSVVDRTRNAAMNKLFERIIEPFTNKKDSEMIQCFQLAIHSGESFHPWLRVSINYIVLSRLLLTFWQVRTQSRPRRTQSRARYLSAAAGTVYTRGERLSQSVWSCQTVRFSVISVVLSGYETRAPSVYRSPPLQFASKCSVLCVWMSLYDTMLGSNGNQYLRPEYLSPLPTTVRFNLYLA